MLPKEKKMDTASLSMIIPLLIILPLSSIPLILLIIILVRVNDIDKRIQKNFQDIQQLLNRNQQN